MKILKQLLFIGVVIGWLLVAACAPAGVDALAGTDWDLVSLAGETPVANATIGFENGRLGGITGCNNYGGSYTVSGNQLTLEDGLEMTEMACLDEGVMAQEQQFASMLLAVQSFAISGDTLTLLDGAGNPLMQFRAG